MDLSRLWRVVRFRDIYSVCNYDVMTLFRLQMMDDSDTAHVNLVYVFVIGREQKTWVELQILLGHECVGIAIRWCRHWGVERKEEATAQCLYCASRTRFAPSTHVDGLLVLSERYLVFENHIIRPSRLSNGQGDTYDQSLLFFRGHGRVVRGCRSAQQSLVE
jgi:hypothetical protein